MRHIRVFAATSAALMLATFASAQNWFFNDPIDRGQVVPPTGSPATGTAVGNYDSTTNVMNINVLANGFVSAPNAAHIHGPAPPGVNTGIQFNLGVGGTLPNYFNPFTQFVLSPAQEVDFLAGLYYAQIHTTANPGGDIRGQLNPVPEPASLLALAAGSALLIRRRMRLKR